MGQQMMKICSHLSLSKADKRSAFEALDELVG